MASKRAENFSKLDLSFLTEEIERNIEILNSKQTNDITNKRKQQVWEGIVAGLNSRGENKRSVQQVKEKWRKMCSAAKKAINGVKRDSKKTGGGPCPIEVDQNTAKIGSIYAGCPNFFGIDGGLETGVVALPVDFLVSQPSESSECLDVHITQVPSLDIIQGQQEQIRQTPAKTATTTRVENEYAFPSQLGNTPTPLYMRKRSTSSSSDRSIGPQELRTLQVETLKAEKEKYIYETAMIKMNTEKLGMEKELLELKIKRVKLELAERGYDLNMII